MCLFLTLFDGFHFVVFFSIFLVLSFCMHKSHTHFTKSHQQHHFEPKIFSRHHTTQKKTKNTHILYYFLSPTHIKNKTLFVCMRRCIAFPASPPTHPHPFILKTNGFLLPSSFSLFFKMSPHFDSHLHHLFSSSYCVIVCLFFSSLL
eukprot:UN10909